MVRYRLQQTGVCSWGIYEEKEAEVTKECATTILHQYICVYHGLMEYSIYEYIYQCPVRRKGGGREVRRGRDEEKDKSGSKGGEYMEGGVVEEGE